MAANVKLYFQTLCGEVDVRKELLLKSDFQHLQLKIQELDIEDVSDRFRVEYVDQDGDKVAVETNEEFQIALKEQGREPYKFYVKAKRKMKSPEAMGSNEEHSKLVCISCHGVIRGFRYKCVSCANYDICQRCESSSIHPAHDMLRIASPSKIYPPHFFSRLQRLYEKVFHPQSFHSAGSLSKSAPNLEPIARDFVEDDECFVEAAEEFLCEESSLPSIEELTKNVQCLIDRDLADDQVTNAIEENVISINFIPIQDNNEAYVEENTVECETNEIEDNLFMGKKDHGQTCEKDQASEDNQNALNAVQTPLKKDADVSSEAQVTKESADDHLKEKKDRTKIDALDPDKPHKKLPQERSSTLSKLQEEIDKLLAPLTPPKSQSDTPKNEVIAENDDESSTSSVSSSPFELCAIAVQTSAIVEPVRSESNVVTKGPEVESKITTIDGIEATSTPTVDVEADNSTMNGIDSKPATTKESLGSIELAINQEGTTKNQGIDVISRTESCRMPDEAEIITCSEDVLIAEDESEKKPSSIPLSSEEAAAILKVVEDQERIELQNAGIDSYMLASSRLLLRKQLRSQNTEAARSSFSFDTYSYPTRSRTMNYTSDTYDYRPPYLQTTSLSSDLPSRTYSSRPSSTYYSSYGNSSNTSSVVSEAVGQMISMGFSDDDGWLTQLCTIKKGNIEQVLDVLTPVKK